MIQKINIEGLTCYCATADATDRVAYILYPMDMLGGWLATAPERYKTNIVVVTGMDWQNVFSPWPAPGVPKGTADFKGQSPEFLQLLQQKVIPQAEAALNLQGNVTRSLVGVSMSGLFALWQWMVCDTFTNIACLSGSFWYPHFVEWMQSRQIPAKDGVAYFLLGKQEPHSKNKTFATVGKATQEILTLLKQAHIPTEFNEVEGDHYSDAIPRLDRAFSALYL